MKALTLMPYIIITIFNVNQTLFSAETKEDKETEIIYRLRDNPFIVKDRAKKADALIENIQNIERQLLSYEELAKQLILQLEEIDKMREEEINASDLTELQLMAEEITIQLKTTNSLISMLEKELRNKRLDLTMQ